MEKDLIMFRYFQATLIVICLLLFLFVEITFTRFYRRKLKDFLSLQEMNKNLEQEITKRNQAKEAMRKSEEKFKTIFNNAGVGIAIIDLSGKFLNCNSAILKIYGGTVPDFVGQNFKELVPPDYQGNAIE